MGSDAETSELAPGLWSWARRHPEWHPGDFGREVVSFMARAGEETLLLDPLLDGPGDPAWGLIDGEIGGSASVLISIPYHVRSAEAIRDRYAGEARISIRGHAACAKRLESTEGFEPLEPGEELAGGVVPHRIGKPVRHETPLEIPSHDAILFGDALVGTDEGPRVWTAKRLDEGERDSYSARLNPTIEPLVELGPERLLLTHGPSVLSDGAAELARALALGPWYHPG